MITKEREKKDKLRFGLKLTQVVFLAFSIVGTMAFFGKLFISGNINLDAIGTGVTAAIFWTLFYGTYKIKSWVVTPALIVSAFIFISNLIKILTLTPETTGELFNKAYLILVTIFFLFQLYYFSRSETREYFKEDGTTLVS